MSNVILTIIIPVYNNPMIKDALESVKKIKNKNIELIVVDGYSNDETVDIVKRYCNIVDLYICEKDSGPYDAANKGIRVAKGEWVFWLAADDIILKNPVDMLEKYNINNEFDIICGSILEEKENGEVMICKSEDNISRLTYHCSLRQPSTVFRKMLFQKYGLYSNNYRFAADREIFLRFRENGAKFKIVDDCITFFRYGGLTTSKRVVDSYREDNIISIKYGASRLITYLLYITRLLKLYTKNIRN